MFDTNLERRSAPRS